MAVQVTVPGGNIFQRGLPAYAPAARPAAEPPTESRRPGRLARPSRRAILSYDSRIVDLRRRRRLRRLRQAGSTALWVTGSGFLSLLVVGGLFGLH